MVGVQFKLDGAEPGTRSHASLPSCVRRGTPTTAANGATCADRRGARRGRQHDDVRPRSAVTVNNAVDVDSARDLSGVGAPTASRPSEATIVWTTNEPADSQVELRARPPPTAPPRRSHRHLVLVPFADAGRTGAGDPVPLPRAVARRRRQPAPSPADFTFTTLPAARPARHRPSRKFDEGTGTTTADAVRQRPHRRRLTGGATWAAGSTGLGVALDGVDWLRGRRPRRRRSNAFPLTRRVVVQDHHHVGVGGPGQQVPGRRPCNGYQIFFENGSLCAWYMRDASNYVYDGSRLHAEPPPATTTGSGTTPSSWSTRAGGRLYVDGIQKASQPWTGTAGATTTTQDLHARPLPRRHRGASFLAGLDRRSADLRPRR